MGDAYLSDHRRFEPAVACAATVAVALLAATILEPSQQIGRLVMMVVAGGVCAALLSRVSVAVAASALGYLLYAAFLSRDGDPIAEGLLADGYVFAFVAAALIGLGYRRLRAVQADAALEAELDDLLYHAGRGDDGRDSRRA